MEGGDLGDDRRDSALAAEQEMLECLSQTAQNLRQGCAAGDRLQDLALGFEFRHGGAARRDVGVDDDGAKLACGGKRLSRGDYANGYFIEPTVFSDAAPDIAPATVVPDRNLRDQFDFDSMDTLHFAAAISREFAIDVAEADYGELASLSKACDYVRRKLPASSV